VGDEHRLGRAALQQPGQQPGGAGLPDDHVNGRRLTDAKLTNVQIRWFGPDADFTGTKLTNAKLRGRQVAERNTSSGRLQVDSGRLKPIDDLSDLIDARWPEGAQVPDGWMVDSDSGRLKRAG
jgi:uncharacterized protein YjbI with pentapeptide repeats